MTIGNRSEFDLLQDYSVPFLDWKEVKNKNKNLEK